MNQGHESMQEFVFDPTKVREEDQADAFAPAPPGWYTAEVFGVEYKATRAGGAGLNIEWVITGPRYANKHVWQWINTAHPSKPEVVRIGQGELFRLSEAAGLRGPWRQSHLYGRSCQVKLVVEKHEKYGDKNVVKAVRALQAPQPAGNVGAPPTRQHQGQQQNSQPSPSEPAPQGNPHNDDDIPF